MENDARLAKEELSELARTATDYEVVIQRKTVEIDRLTDEVNASRRESEVMKKEIAALQSDIDTLTKELEDQATDGAKVNQAKAKLESELDDLRKLMAAKTDEETRRSKVEASQEQELSALRSQVSNLQSELTDVRRSTTESTNKLKLDIETAQRERETVVKALEEAQAKAKKFENRLNDVEYGIVTAEKAKRTAESELQSIRSRQIDLDGQLAEASKAKEALERQLASANAKHQDFEDAMLQIERDKASWVRQMDNLRKELEEETAKRTRLEKTTGSQGKEIIQLKDRCTKFDRDLVKAQNDIRDRDWEINQLRSKQDKTIVEHVHVLQEAKAFTDRQLAEAQLELEKQKTYIKSLEKTRSRLVGESEDLARETERERQELRAKEKALRTNEEKVTKALAEAQLERTSRETAEIQARRTQEELVAVKNQLDDATRQMANIQRAKAHLEAELANLAEETDNQTAVTKIRQQYEQQISQLEAEAREAQDLRATAERIKQHIERQQIELRRLISSAGPRDENFRARLLKEIEAVDQQLEAEFSSRGKGGKSRTLANLPPSTPVKKGQANGYGHLPDTPTKAPSTPDRQATQQLRQQVQVLELQMVASNRVRQHLEASLRELTNDLQNSDGSKQSLESHRAKLSRENARLGELLNDEAEARQASNGAQMDGVKAMWDKFQQTLTNERESYNRLEESRRALVRFSSVSSFVDANSLQ